MMILWKSPTFLDLRMSNLGTIQQFADRSRFFNMLQGKIIINIMIFTYRRSLN